MGISAKEANMILSSMAPTRKKSVNKRFLNEVSPHKELKNSNKRKKGVTRKRRFSDELGPRWSEGELQRFYKAYQAHGLDWKKVAAEVPNRSVEMVDALYKMNKAYLSLPEGVSSAVGLIAMMSDHYNTLEVSDSEQESNDGPGISRKSQKCKQAKVMLGVSNADALKSQSIASTDGYLSLLKKGHFYGGQPRAVGKRTPRIPVSLPYKKNEKENYVSLKKGQKLENVHDDVAHVAALALTEAVQRRGSPQVSHTPHRRTEHIKSSPVRSSDRMFLRSKAFHAKLRDASICEEWMEDGINWGADTGTCVRDTSSLLDMEGVGTVEVHRKGKKFCRKKVKVEDIGNYQSDDGGEACSGTEEGPKVNALKGKVITDEPNAKFDKTSPQSHENRSDKHFSGDEFSALDALQTLANISAMESEPSAQFNEERTTCIVDEKCSIPEAMSTSHDRDKIKPLRCKEKVFHTISEVEGASRKSKLGRHTANNTKPVSEAKRGPLTMKNNTNALKKKCQFLVSKAPNAEAPINSHLSELLQAGSVDEEEIISALKGKPTGQISAIPKQLKAIGVPKGSFSGDHKSSPSHAAISTAHVPVASQITLPIRKVSRRKMDLMKAFRSKEGNASENILKNQANNYSVSDKTLYLKEKLSCCLSSPMVRRWCMFEWFYSGIDYPWFAQREFVEYLKHVGLGRIPRLTRVEWGVIRSSLGKPRRFSEHFIREEREKLNKYRDSVRKHYTELRAGVREGLPTDLARPLSVGQRVIAVHPKTRELHDGSVLTINHDRCGVQFDCPEIGVEFVKDIDCMPLNPLDNMPEALRYRFSVISEELQVTGHSNVERLTSSRNLENFQTPMNTSVKQADTNCSSAKAASINTVNSQQKVYSQTSAMAQLQVKQADIQVLSEVNHSLGKKASSALHNLRRQNTNAGNTVSPWLKPPASSSCPGGLPTSHVSFVSQELGYTVAEIVRGSRNKAHTMVDAAVQAISSMKEGEDAFVKIGEALDSIDRRQLALESKAQVKSPEQVGGILSHHEQLISSTSDVQVNSTVYGPKSYDNTDKFEVAIPSELITSCVATLLMIQTCTERQYPPADVAQIIDSAVSSLHPCSSQNLPIYTEIKMCMGRIKTQMLALIPT